MTILRFAKGSQLRDFENDLAAAARAVAEKHGLTVRMAGGRVQTVDPASVLAKVSGGPTDDREVAEANAAFIVRAVNAHDDLVKALEPFARMARGMSEVEQMDHVLFKRLDSEGRVMLDQITADDFVRALAALSKAGE
jgi:hypothetical protein